MRCCRFLALAIFTFAIGVFISPIRFYPESIACGWNSSSTRFRSSYFIHLTAGSVGYDSEQKASEAFDKELNDALEVYDRSPKVNKKGVLIEQRAVGLFYHQGTGEYYVRAFWRDGQHLRRITSRSHMLVKDYEKRYF